jgi:hypothetical protein
VGAALKNLNRWVYLMAQIHEARYYVARAEELGHPHLWTTYEAILDFLANFRGALNSYAKCFVSSGAGRTSLMASTVFGSDATNFAAHGRIIELRHKYVAHSDSNELETVHVAEEQSDKELVLNLQYSLTFPFDRLYELRALIKFVDEYIVDRQAEHLGSVSREIGKTVRVREGSNSE